MNRESFLRRYGILLILTAAFTIYTILLSSWVSWRTEKRVHAEMDAAYEQRVEQRIAEYHEQKQQEQRPAGKPSSIRRSTQWRR